MDLSSTIEEKKQRLEELRKLREKRQLKSKSDIDSRTVDSLLEHILKSSDGLPIRMKGTASESNVRIPGIKESEDGYSESRIPPAEEQSSTVERYEKSVQTNTDYIPSNLIPKAETNAVPVQTVKVDTPVASANTITAIKKKIIVRDNEEGISEIKKNLEAASVCSSVGIVERALGQLEEYDYLNEYIDLTSNSAKSRDLLSFSKCYVSEPITDHAVTSIHLSPFSKSIFLVSYTSSLTASNSFEGFCALWDMMITDHPYRVLNAPESVTAAQFHNLDRNLLIGGLYNGRVVVWDLTSETGIQTQSNLNDEQSSLPVVGLEVFGSSTLSGVLSVSSDGVVCIWSQNSFIDPIITTNLNSLTLESHELEQPILPTAISSFNGELSSFLVGSEDGSLYSIIIRDNVISIDARLQFHSAPITSISMRLSSAHSRVSAESTAVRNLVLTSSFDWQVALWAPTISLKPLAVFSPATSYVTYVQWHPVNPAIFAVAVEGGVIQIWNILQDRDMPLVTMNVSMAEAGRAVGGATCLQWSDNGRSLLVGTESGRILVLEMKAELVEIREEGYAMMNRLIEELIQDLNSDVWFVCLVSPLV